MKDPLGRLSAIAAWFGVAAAVLIFILILPEGVHEDEEAAANAAALAAIGWTLAKFFGAVAIGAGVLVIGLTPVVTYLQKVLAKQEALERALQKDAAQRPVLMEYKVPAALPEHTLE